MNRREILAGAVGAAAIAGAIGAQAQTGRRGGPQVRMLPAPSLPPGARLSLSMIISEYDRTRVSAKNRLSFPEFLELAKGAGYNAIHIRASMAGIHTPLDQLHTMAGHLKASGLGVSSVCPDFPVPLNTDNAPDCLRNITPYLTFAEIFGSDMIRIGMKTEADIPFAQRAADEAAERRIRLVHHAELNTMFNTYDSSLRTLKAVNRPNFGLQHDEAQWMCVMTDYRPELMLERLKSTQPWAWEVFIKNNPGGPGPQARPTIPLEAPNGVQFDRYFDALNTLGYKGYIQTHQLPQGTADIRAGCINYARFIRARTRA